MMCRVRVSALDRICCRHFEFLAKTENPDPSCWASQRRLQTEEDLQYSPSFLAKAGVMRWKSGPRPSAVHARHACPHITSLTPKDYDRWMVPPHPARLPN